MLAKSIGTRRYAFGMPTVDVLVRTAVAIVVLAGIAVSILRASGVAQWQSPALALVRATVQLTLLSVILAGVIQDAVWVCVALVVMFLVAVWVSTSRSGDSLSRAWRTAMALAAGVGGAGSVVFLTGAVEFSPRFVLAVGAMVIGNAMTVASVAGRTFAQLRTDRRPEVEAWLALGATPRRATRDLGRRAAHDALLPGIDQVRTAGLVVLPGAFVGAIFGGLSPVDAGRFQLVVLAAIMAAGAITSVTVIRLASGSISGLSPAPTRTAG